MCGIGVDLIQQAVAIHASDLGVAEFAGVIGLFDPVEGELFYRCSIFILVGQFISAVSIGRLTIYKPNSLKLAGVFGCVPLNLESSIIRFTECGPVKFSFIICN